MRASPRRSDCSLYVIIVGRLDINTIHSAQMDDACLFINQILRSAHTDLAIQINSEQRN